MRFPAIAFFGSAATLRYPGLITMKLTSTRPGWLLRDFINSPHLTTLKFFPLVVKPVIVRLILILALVNKWSIQQFDVNNAFINGFLEEEVYMQQPVGFEHPNKNMVCKLNKAIYGLKQAPRAWFERLAKTLLVFGFHSSKCPHS